MKILGDASQRGVFFFFFLGYFAVNLAFYSPWEGAYIANSQD